MILYNIHFDFSAVNDDTLIMAAIGYLTVFSALVLLFFVFNNLPKIINSNIRQKLRKEGKDIMDENLEISGEVNAAISASLYLYLNEMHDDESDIITIKRVSKTYSPWSSKIYGLSNFRRLN